MERLIEGYRRFRAGTWPEERTRYEALSKEGQRPIALVVACSDSRVDPQTIFGAAPGELFVIRNVAALVPPYQPDAGYHGTSAALGYGLRVLGISSIVVLGHAQCGGVKAMVEGAPAATDFVNAWMQIAKPAMQVRAKSRPEGNLDLYEHEVVRLSLGNLMTFPWIHTAVARGRIQLHGCRFDIRSGTLAILKENRFVNVGV
jgi:carbonic anhydrase